MFIDSHHSTPWEMTFESARVTKLYPQMESFSPLPAFHGIISIFQKRDAFCHLLQLMKMRHSQQSEPDVISVFVGTWNMGKPLPPTNRGTDQQSVFSSSLLLFRFVFSGGSPPPRTLQTWMTCCGLGHTPDEATALLPHDIYAVGTQENPQGEKEWSEQIKATLRSYTHIEFKQVMNLLEALFIQCSVLGVKI